MVKILKFTKIVSVRGSVPDLNKGTPGLAGFGGNWPLQKNSTSNFWKMDLWVYSI